MGPLIHPVVRREGIPNFIAKLDHLFLNMSSTHFAHAKRVLHDFLVADLSQGEEYVLHISEIVDIAITRRLTGAPAFVGCVRMVVLDDVRPEESRRVLDGNFIDFLLRSSELHELGFIEQRPACGIAVP